MSIRFGATRYTCKVGRFQLFFFILIRRRNPKFSCFINDNILYIIFYTCKVDVWGAAIVLTEMLLGVSLFYGASSTREQALKVMEYLGPPSVADCVAMNVPCRNWPRSRRLKSISAAFNSSWYNRFTVHLLTRLLSTRKNASISEQFPNISKVHFICRLLVYNPSRRLSAWEVCVHPFFGNLHRKAVVLPNGSRPARIFNFTPFELASMPDRVKGTLKALL